MRYLLILICCLIPFLSYASGPQVLVQGTATGTTQLQLSTVDGTAFLDTDGTVPCTSFIGEKIEIIDSAGKKISGFVKANVAVDTDVTYQVGATADDGEKYATAFLNGYVSLGYSGGSYNPFFRWTSVEIPAGSTITAAKVQLRAKNSDSGKTVNMNIYFNDVDNATAPTDVATYDAKAVTAAVAWNSIGAFTAGTWYDSPELKTILQAVIDRAGWASGNAIMVLMKDNGSSNYRRMNDYDDGASYAAKLVVTYTTPRCTIVSSPGGATYNWNIKESGFNPNSATFTWRILSTNAPGRQIAGGSLTAANVRLATVDGGAMVHLVDVDLSAYAGDDAGGPVTIINPKSTSAATMTTNKYLLALYDSSGRVATGVIGAVGGGETLDGTNLVTEWTNGAGGLAYDTFTSVASPDIAQAVSDGDPASRSATSNAAVTTVGSLYKLVATLTVNSGEAPDLSGTGGFPTTELSAGANTVYFTATGTSVALTVTSGGATDYACTFVLKKVTDVAATGVRLHGTANATDRKMKASGCNADAVTSYKIYRTY